MDWRGHQRGPHLSSDHPNKLQFLHYWGVGSQVFLFLSCFISQYKLRIFLDMNYFIIKCFKKRTLGLTLLLENFLPTYFQPCLSFPFLSFPFSFPFLSFLLLLLFFNEQGQFCLWKDKLKNNFQSTGLGEAPSQSCYGLESPAHSLAPPLQPLLGPRVMFETIKAVGLLSCSKLTVLPESPRPILFFSHINPWL